MNVVELQRNHLSEKIQGLVSGLELITKRLKIQSVGKTSNKRKLVISTNWLNLIGLTENTPVSEEVFNDQGIKGLLIKKSLDGNKKVYGRDYSNRDRETMMDIRHQSKLDEAFGDATHVHIKFEQDQLTIVPDYNVLDRKVNEGILFHLQPTEGIYHGIVDALNFIKEKAFEHIAIEAPSGFVTSEEYTLFCIQLRRLGYTLDRLESGKLTAYLTGEAVSKIREVDVSELKPKVKDLEFNDENTLESFVACTGGVDIACLESDGFQVTGALEWMPPEARDYKKTKKADGEVVIKHNDKTEFGAISAAINSKYLKTIFNEDFYHFQYQRVADFLKNKNVLHISLQCCDFSSLKSLAERIKAINSLNTTRDMIFPAMHLIECMNSPVVAIENIQNFSNSIECQLLEHRLESLGYTVHKEVLKAGEMNGYTLRSRCYLVATKLDAEFKFPSAQERVVNAWEDIIANNLDELRDVTHTKSVAKGITTGRIRPFRVGESIAPTVTRSQSRQCKDSLYIEIDDRYYMPSNKVLKELMSIPESFNLSVFNNETGTEIIGQSICFNMHSLLCKQIKSHIQAFTGCLNNSIKQSLASFKSLTPNDQLCLAF